MGRFLEIRPPNIGHCFLVGVAFRVEGNASIAGRVTFANAITKAPILSASRHLLADPIRSETLCTVNRHPLRLCNLCRMTATWHLSPNVRAGFRQHHVAQPQQCSITESSVRCIPPISAVDQDSVPLVWEMLMEMSGRPVDLLGDRTSTFSPTYATPVWFTRLDRFFARCRTPTGSPVCTLAEREYMRRSDSPTRSVMPPVASGLRQFSVPQWPGGETVEHS